MSDLNSPVAFWLKPQPWILQQLYERVSPFQTAVMSPRRLNDPYRVRVQPLTASNSFGYQAMSHLWGHLTTEHIFSILIFTTFIKWAVLKSTNFSTRKISLNPMALRQSIGAIKSVLLLSDFKPLRTSCLDSFVTY